MPFTLPKADEGEAIWEKPNCCWDATITGAMTSKNMFEKIYEYQQRYLKYSNSAK